jgi:hypothetical protein
MKARHVILATMSVVVGLNACGDINSIKASLPTSVDTLAIFALSGTPPDYPSGLSFLARQPVLVDGFAVFDIAFDIDQAGNTIVYPVKLVVASPGGSRPVGLQVSPAPFEQVTSAPKEGYQSDTAVMIHPGQTLIVQSAHNYTNGDICQFALNPNLFAKIAVDSVNLVTRTVHFRFGLDPNCGFRSFAEGIPTN